MPISNSTNLIYDQTVLPDSPPAASEPDHGLAEFWNATGANLPRRFIVTDRTSKVAEVPFDRPYLIVGRSPHCDVTLAHYEISSRHLYLQRLGESVLWFDLASLNGVFCGKRRAESGQLKESKPLRMGPFSLRVTSDALKAPTPFPVFHGPSEAESPDASLVLLNGSGAGLTQQLRNPVTLLGRARPCSLRLKHESIARVHCSLVRTPDGLWVVDLIGGDGVLINGTRTACGALVDGAELQVGDFRFRVQSHAGNRPALRVAAPQAIVSSPFPAALPQVSLAPQPQIPNVWSAVPQLNAGALEAAATPDGMIPQSLVVGLFREFAAMQQQMFEQSQQALLMMAQTFGGLFRDQMQSLQAEINRVHELTAELQTLQQQFAELKSGAATPAASLPAEPALKSGSFRISTSLLEPLSEISGATSPEVHELGEEKLNDEVDESFESTLSESSAPAEEPVHRAVAGCGAEGLDPHAWLCERISVITAERNSRWEKIMGTLLRR